MPTILYHYTTIYYTTILYYTILGMPTILYYTILGMPTQPQPTAAQGPRNRAARGWAATGQSRGQAGPFLAQLHCLAARTLTIALYQL